MRKTWPHLWPIVCSCFFVFLQFITSLTFSKRCHNTWRPRVLQVKYLVQSWRLFTYANSTGRWGECGEGVKFRIYYLTEKTIQMDLLTLFFFSLAGKTLAAVLLTAHVNTWDIDHLQTTQQSDLMSARHKCWGSPVFPSSASLAPSAALFCGSNLLFSDF